MLAPQQSDAKALLIAAIDRYKALTSYSATIEHHNDSGLFPGNYTQSLKWKKGHRFELIVTKANPDKLDAGSSGMKAPNYYADGTKVVAISPDGSRRESDVAPEPNTSPGWEVSGGLVVTFLEQTAQVNFLLNPPSQVNARYVWGTNKTWMGMAVREVVLIASVQGQDEEISLYFDPKDPILIGNRFVRNKVESWMRYQKQQENPPLPDPLGVPPVEK